MEGFPEELTKILLNPDANLRDEELFAFVERIADDDPSTAIEAANSIGEYYKRGWALLLCVQALVKLDIERARTVAATIEDEYNRFRAEHTILFTEAKKNKKTGFEPGMN
jgi:hypothetical protein